MAQPLRMFIGVLSASLIHAALIRAASMAGSPSSTRPQPPTASSQAPPALRASTRIQSPDIQADRRVTFRLRAPNAHAVTVTLEGSKPLAMQKDDQGVWTVTTEPVEPDFYGYWFAADGTRLLDPSNAAIKPNLISPQSVVHVPGPSTLPWEQNDVPHGIVHRHEYRSNITGRGSPAQETRSGSAGDTNSFYVYTPPSYDPVADRRYPTLYLLHGMSDGADAWSSALGRANVILDNLIAQGTAKPMLVVMPLGYGAPEILAPGATSRDPGLGQRNRDKFREALLGEIIPMIERTYRVATDRESRAIAGLSMGGTEALTTGLNAVDRFGWIGAFSSGGIPEDFARAFPRLDGAATRALRLLWIACGTEDGLLESNRKVRAWLQERGVNHVDIETPGSHTWMVWRRNLAAFAPLLFR